MNQQEMMKLAIAAGILYGVYKFAPSSLAKGAAVAVAAVAVAKRVPYLSAVL